MLYLQYSLYVCKHTYTPRTNPGIDFYVETYTEILMCLVYSIYFGMALRLIFIPSGKQM